MVQAPASAPALSMSICAGAILRKAKWTVTVFPSGVLSQQFTGKTIKPKVFSTIVEGTVSHKLAVTREKDAPYGQP